MLTRKDYKAIAEIIKANTNNECAAGAYNIGLELADYFAKDNPRFDKDKFLKACGLED